MGSTNGQTVLMVILVIMLPGQHQVVIYEDTDSLRPIATALIVHIIFVTNVYVSRVYLPPLPGGLSAAGNRTWIRAGALCTVQSVALTSVVTPTFRTRNDWIH